MNSIRTFATGAAIAALVSLMSSCNCGTGNGADGGTGGGTTSSTTGGGSAATGGGSSTGGGTAVTGGGTATTGGGSGLTGGGSGTATSAEIVQAVTAVGNAICARAAACGAISSDSLATCQNYYSASFPNTVEALDAGRLLFSSTQLSACASAISTASCLNFDSVNLRSPPPPCDTAFTGSVSVGNRCGNDGECNANLLCRGASCAAVCVATGGVNQPCNFAGNTGCNAGLWCDGTSSLCRAPGTAGDTCNLGRAGSCAVNFKCDEATTLCVRLPADTEACPQGQCDSTTFCDPNDSVCHPRTGLNSTCNSPDACQAAFRCNQSSTCVARPTMGQPCVSYDECAPGLNCDSLLKSCQADTQVDPGQPCTNGQLRCKRDSCRNTIESTDGGVGVAGVCGVPQIGDRCFSHSSCPALSYCTSSGLNTAGVCATATSGNACNGNENCASGEYCSMSVCHPRIASGAVCDEMTVCAVPTQRCLALPTAPTDFRCRAQGGASAACADSNGCALGFMCVNQVCVLAGSMGAPCVGNELCFDGTCLELDAGVRRCGAKAADGASCFINAGCVSGYCDPVHNKCTAACF